jgi:hypothetical protein
MNKKKLVELADEVLTDLDVDLENLLRANLEEELCNQLHSKFYNARNFLKGRLAHGVGYVVDEKSYKSVKPILDDAIDKLLNKAN